MTAKEYLQQIEEIDIRINLNLDRVKNMKSKAIYSGGCEQCRKLVKVMCGLYTSDGGGAC